jgi:hypothetical protein
MHRTFNLTLPNDSAYHNLYSLIVGTAVYGLVHGGTDETGITGAIPTDGILPDRIQSLDLLFPDSNSAVVVFVSDRNHANETGKSFSAGDNYHKDSARNSICMKDYFLSSGASEAGVVVEIESV